MPFNNSSVEACSAPDWCYFNNETSIDEAGVYPLPLLVIFCFSYAFIFLLGTVGNIVTLTVILKTRYLHNKTNFYLCSLAVSDLLILIFGLPSEVAYLVKNDRFYGGDWLCILRGLLSETATNASVLTVATFTLERWVAICKPFGTNQGSCGRVAGHITLIWLVAVGGAIPLAYQFGVTSYEDPCTCQVSTNIHSITGKANLPHSSFLLQINHDVSYCSVLKSRKLTYSFEVSSVIFFATPMFLMAVVYVRIVRQLKISFKLLSRPSTLASSPLVLQDTRNRQAIRSKTLVVRMLSTFRYP